MVFLRRFACVSLLLLLGLAVLRTPPTRAQANFELAKRLTFTTVDVPGDYVLNNVAGINKAGVMVGSYSATNGSGLYQHGFVYANGTFSYFDYPEAQSTSGSGINDSGLIVGSAQFEGGLIVRGFLYDGQTFTPFDAPGQPQTYPSGINNAGEVVGAAGVGGGTIRPFEMLNDRFTTIKVPGQYLIKTASGINNSGGVTGYVSDGDAGLPDNGYLYKEGKLTTIGFPGAYETAASGINDSGVIVGWYSVLHGCECAFALKNGRYVSFSYPGAVATAGEGVNASGQVVGQYTFDYQTYHGFVTSPIADSDFK
jgi:probable HAF family extracellular repeat protein